MATIHINKKVTLNILLKTKVIACKWNEKQWHLKHNTVICIKQEQKGKDK